MYRNIVYSPFDKEVTLFTWDNQGNRIEERYPFKPYLYIDDPTGQDGISIYNTPLKKIEFENSFKRREFVNVTSKTYENLQAEQQYLIERYAGQNKDLTFSIYPLKIYFIDIETYSPNGFPDPQKALDTINLISVYDSLTGGIYTFGLKKEYYTNDDKVIYKCFETEEAMIKAFLRWWRKDFPDVVSGWYSDGFDIPYLCKRINNIYKDEKACNRLSPVGVVYRKENVKKRLMDYDEIYTIVGVTHIDYQYAYKVFTREQRASYSLNSIGEEELGVGKKPINAVSLSTLADTDWNNFVDYNIQDVRLLIQLEDKLQYLSICRELAYRGLSPIINALSTVGLVTGVAAQKAKEKGKILSTFTPQEASRYEGGFVREPQKGIINSLLYYDANSLYPNTIITLNISPETKFGKIIERDEQKNLIKIQTISNKEYCLPKADFDRFVENNEIAISKSNILFTQKTPGIFPDIIEEIYADRLKIQKELKQCRKDIDNFPVDSFERKRMELKIQQLDIQQYTVKIFLNRIYGYFGEKHSPIYDIDLASSVTLTGQSCIKEASNICNNYIKTTHGVDYDAIVMNDTDSIVLTIEPILQKVNQPFLINNEINPYVYTIANEIKTTIDTGINTWAKQELHSKNPKYVFKRENISTAGAFLTKKNYILNIRDDDDKKVDKFKYVGVEVNKTSTPKKIKPMLKNAIESLIRRRNKLEVEAILKDIYEKYQRLSVEEIAIPMSLNNLEKYKAKANGFKIGKRTPINVKSAIYFNLLLEYYNLLQKYEMLKEGNKLRFIHVLPNKFNIETVGFVNILPEEFKTDIQPDIKEMFTKTVLNPMNRVLEAIGWKIKSPLLEEKVNLLDMLS